MARSKRPNRRKRRGYLWPHARSLARGLRRLSGLSLRALNWILRKAWPLAKGLVRTSYWAVRGFIRWACARPWRAADLSVAASSLLAVALLFVPPAVVVDLDDSLDCMALNIYHEARGEPLEGQLAVAKVVMNRVAHPRFPDDVCAVVKQGGEWPFGRCQFSWWCDCRSDRVRDHGSMAAIRSLSREVLSGARHDPSEGALWYHATSVKPAWRRDFVQGPIIGDHIFYRPK